MMLNHETRLPSQATPRPASRIRLMALILCSLVLCTAILAPAASAHERQCRGANMVIRANDKRMLRAVTVCLINRERRAHRLPALREDSLLNRSAQDWTNDMVDHRAFSHGADFASRISAVGFQWSRAAENIASGYETPASVVSAWMASPGHCENILSPLYREIGTGVSGRATIASPGTWTQDFALGRHQRQLSDNFSGADGCPYR